MDTNRGEEKLCHRFFDEASTLFPWCSSNLVENIPGRGSGIYPDSHNAHVFANGFHILIVKVRGNKQDVNILHRHYVQGFFHGKYPLCLPAIIREFFGKQVAFIIR